MKTFGKILIAAAATAAAVVVAKKVIDEIEKVDGDSKLVKGYKKAVGTVKDFISGSQAGKPRNFNTDGYDIDFYDDDEDYCHCVCDECLFDDGCDDDGEYFDFTDEELLENNTAFLPIDKDEPTDEEIQEIINEEMAQEHIDKILSEMDAEDEE